MALTDMTVIYFAFGSPFGVYQMTRERVPNSRSAAAAAIYFLLWPAFALAFIGQWLSKNALGEKIDIDKQVEDTRTQLEALAFPDHSIDSIFEFREIFARYTGLAIALKQNGSRTFYKDLFKISMHEDADRAAACLDRRNRDLLYFHKTRAELEFAEFISAISCSNGSEIEKIMSELTVLLRE